ncbi:MAG TPA: acyl-CoA dehydrogenase family protein [Acidimicrobiia bacterium]
MDFEFSDDQELLRASVRRFLAEQAPIAYVRALRDDERGTTDDVWTGLAELGVTGLLAPEEYGGAAGGMVDMAVVLEELGRAVHPGPFASSAVGAVSVVTLAGSDDDRAELLPGLASGETVATVALDEADVRANGERRLTGKETHLSDAFAADIIFVSATGPDGERGVFVVDRDGPGVTVTPTPTVDGTRKFAALELVDAPARRIGAGDATDAVAETADRVVAAAVVDGVGAASRALEMAVDYAKEREQFDRPIGSFQAVQHLCADMLRAVELARAGAYYACWAADGADAAERHRAATMAQAFAADELYAVGASLIQVLGGIGFTWEHDAHLYYKRLLTLKELAGGSSRQLEELAALILD